MKKSIAGIYFLFVIICQLSAQTATDTLKRRIRVSEASICQSALIQQNAFGTLEDFNTLAPQSKILQKDLSDYSTPRTINIDAQLAFSAKIGLSLADKNKHPYDSHPVLRIGVTYKKMTQLSFDLQNSTSERTDTLTSSHGAAPLYVDSITSYNVGMHYESEELRADISLIFSTNPQSRWQVFGGLGFTAGSSFNSYATITYDKTTYGLISSNGYNAGNYPDNYSYNSGQQNGEHIYEHFRNANGFGCSVYIPMGVDFRLGRKRPFWKRLHLYYEAKPYFNSYSVAGLRTISSIGFENGLGARVSF